MQLFRLYQETMNLVKQKFSRGELCMLIDIHNSTYLDPHTTPHMLIAQVEDSFCLYPGEYENKWDVKKDEMLTKIKTLDPWQTACLTIWANDYWYDSRTGATVKSGDSLNVYLKDAPTIIRDLETAQAALEKSIMLMEQSKSAMKSKTIAQARAEAEKAKTILKKLI